MSRPRLYAIEVNGQYFIVRATVRLASRAERAETNADDDVEIHSVDGLRSEPTPDVTEDEWRRINGRVADAERERIAAEREGYAAAQG